MGYRCPIRFEIPIFLILSDCRRGIRAALMAQSRNGVCLQIRSIEPTRVAYSDHGTQKVVRKELCETAS